MAVGLKNLVTKNKGFLCLAGSSNRKFFDIKRGFSSSSPAGEGEGEGEGVVSNPPLISKNDLGDPEKIKQYLVADCGLDIVKRVRLVNVKPKASGNKHAKECDRLLQFYAETACQNRRFIWIPNGYLELVCGIAIKETFLARIQREWYCLIDLVFIEDLPKKLDRKWNKF